MKILRNILHVKQARSENNLTELVFILDRSGSMSGLEKDTIGGFNSMIEKQKLEKNRAFVTTVLFDSDYTIIHDRLKLKAVPRLSEREYYVRGCTALLDAVGRTIEHIDAIHRYARAEDRPGRTLFVITTDGMENASREYSYEKVKALIDAHKEKDWEFLFLGANIDAAREAARFGIDTEKAANYHADSIGTAKIYDSLSNTISCYMAKPSACISPDWKSDIDEDFMSREK